MAYSVLSQAQNIVADGLSAYGKRLNIISQNMANAKSTGSTPGSLPYARQSVILTQKFDKALGVNTVKVKKVMKDNHNFNREYQPNHPAADAEGYVLLPNVDPLIELTNMMEVTRDIERVLKMYKQTTTLRHQTISLMK